MPEPSAPGTELLADVVAGERRTRERYATVRGASCSPIVAHDAALTVRVHDVTARGIGLLTRRRFERGTMLYIRIQDASQAVYPLLMGKVAHVRTHELGGWLVGCILAGELREAAVRALAERAAESQSTKAST